MLRHILTLAIAATLAPAALLVRGAEQETYYQGKLLRAWFEQLGAESPKLSSFRFSPV
jgi:hypothetical protein